MDTSVAEPAVEQEKEEDGVLLLPPHLSDSLQELEIEDCPELVLVPPPTLLPNGHTNIGGFQALQAIQSLIIVECPKFLSFNLNLRDVKGMGTLEPLSSLTSLTRLDMRMCGDLRCEGHLSKLEVYGPRFFAGWDPRSEVLQVEGAGEEHQLQLASPPCPSTLLDLRTDDAVGLLAAPICSFLSSSLTKLELFTEEMERFTKEQEDALHLLASLQKLTFEDADELQHLPAMHKLTNLKTLEVVSGSALRSLPKDGLPKSLQELRVYSCEKLQHLPAGLHKLTNPKKLVVYNCPAIRSLPKDGLPKSLQELDVHECGNEELTQQCRGLVGTIPNIRL